MWKRDRKRCYSFELVCHTHLYCMILVTSCDALKPLIPPKSWVPGSFCVERRNGIGKETVPIESMPAARLLVPNGLSHSASISSWYCPQNTLRLLSIALEWLTNVKTIWKQVGTLLKHSNLSSFFHILSKRYSCVKRNRSCSSRFLYCCS